MLLGFPLICFYRFKEPIEKGGCVFIYLFPPPTHTDVHAAAKIKCNYKLPNVHVKYEPTLIHVK